MIEILVKHLCHMFFKKYSVNSVSFGDLNKMQHFFMPTSCMKEICTQNGNIYWQIRCKIGWCK